LKVSARYHVHKLNERGKGHKKEEEEEEEEEVGSVLS
jgi:hypothetical protein